MTSTIKPEILDELLAWFYCAPLAWFCSAVDTQIKIAETIVRCGGDYLLALKQNRPVLHADVETFFADPHAEGCESFDTTDADHGRVEQRHHVVRHGFDWLFSDRRYADEPRFPHLAMIGMVQSHTQRGGKIEQERRYYLCSRRLSAQAFARAVRAHWGVENRLHWVLDVIFHDDLTRLRSSSGPENMAVVKHMAMNLLRNPKDRHSLKSRRKLACLNQQYLHALVAQKTPLT